MLRKRHRAGSFEKWHRQPRVHASGKTALSMDGIGMLRCRDGCAVVANGLVDLVTDRAAPAWHPVHHSTDCQGARYRRARHPRPNLHGCGLKSTGKAVGCHLAGPLPKSTPGPAMDAPRHGRRQVTRASLQREAKAAHARPALPSTLLSTTRLTLSSRASASPAVVTSLPT